MAKRVYSQAELADPGHGHSALAWTISILEIIIIAFGATVFMLGQNNLVYLAIGAAVVVGILAKVLSAAGVGTSKGGHSH